MTGIARGTAATAVVGSSLGDDLLLLIRLALDPESVSVELDDEPPTLSRNVGDDDATSGDCDLLIGDLGINFRVIHNTLMVHTSWKDKITLLFVR